MTNIIPPLTESPLMRSLTACVALLCSIQSYAGTVTGTVEGTADVSIAPVIAGQYPPVYTIYQDVPSVLMYSYDLTNQVVQFSITNSVYSLDTASLISRTYPTSYGFLPLGEDERMALTSFTYHVFYLQADLNFSLPDFTLLNAGYTYSATNFSGNGQNVITSFTPNDPPPVGNPLAATPEPSSVVMMAIGLLATLFRSLKCVSLESRSSTPCAVRSALE